MAVGALAAYTAVDGGKVALAQKMPDARQVATTRAEALPVRRYDIPAGPLETTLANFKQTSGASVRLANPILLNTQTPGVSGVFTAEQALQHLLSGTGLTYAFGDEHEFTISLQTAISTVDVNEVAPTLTSSMPKYQQPLLDTPQTVGVVSQTTMQQQGVTTLRDSLRNVAGISLAAGEGGAQGDNLTVRGFTARNDLFIDGMRDFGSYYRDPFNTQEVEVLQGPASVAFGRGSTGGVVNQATKLPNLNQFITVDLGLGTDATRRGTLDWATPVKHLGSGAAFRLNAMGNIGGVADRDVAENRRMGIAPSLALGLGTPTRLTLSYFHQNADDIPDYGIPWLFNGPSPVPHNNYYGLRDGNFLRTYDDIGTARVEHDINDKVTVRDQFRYANYGRRALITEGQLTGVTFGTPLEDMRVTRNEIGVYSTETNLDNQLDLVAHFQTGALRHTFVAGAEGGRETSDPTRPKWTAPKTGLLDPDPTDSLNPVVTVTSRVSDRALSASTYALDTMSIGKWAFSGGVRFDRFDNTYDQFVGTLAHLNRIDQKATWRAAAVYKPVPIGSFYFSAGTSFNPSAEALALSAGTANVAPETNLTYEFGTKWDLRRSRLQVNSSWFRTTKQNAREASPTNPLLYVLAGNQRVSGAEADIRGRVTSRWDLLASYAYLDSRVVSSQFYPGAVGYPLANVPKNTFAFWSTHRLPKHFEVGVGSNYVSSRNASSTAPLDATTHLVKQVPGYWVFNAMASRSFGEHVDLQVNVYNIANRYYYDQLHPGHIVLGPGRYALANLRFRF